ncbi:Ubiquitin-conjugating enzyme E2 [Fulvia fulva]|uniref:Ubiquitin-conjugating enzyme E2 2 n=1 Tax=Passalora fulva TaxID=5499 RepID=A0A9Q8PHR7_PASFU|nr:Ubiquitin-conjugating enzyme E2 [Fulvia fulva]KAK4626871.1 Ubiquitin-conjugating enzyme E2 [Fulvia fulva]KAK4628258.1 Ubiquitin-conjugating enzyme E2 [Fulvia fulva]UJO22655.1 Ubiquitin-conjugating enzyme E2 [Fulvia fulva]WPV14107.1 Ubiquitin-conjugating enzyme E2 [Fulvia fulva]WPV29149.1 Ubiquitin-conjugating enzyme E2 [Fulvia fulva]
MANRLDAMNPTMTSTPSVSQAKAANSASRPATNNQNVIKRLQSELMTLMTSPTAGISAFPSNDMTKWNATMEGPQDTPYQDLTFKLTISYPSNYPYAPPEVLFKTPIYHPNVDFSGRICLDILKPGGEGKEGAWSAALNTSSVLLSIQSLLGEPNNSSPLNGEAAILWDKDQAEFKKKVLARHVKPEDVEDTA